MINLKNDKENAKQKYKREIKGIVNERMNGIRCALTWSQSSGTNKMVDCPEPEKPF